MASEIFRRALQVATAASLGLLLAACGGGGGGSDASALAPVTPAPVVPTTPTGPTGIAANYYPVTAGSTWVYNVSSSTPNTPTTCTQTVTGTQVFKGTNATVLQDNCLAINGAVTLNYYSKTARAYTFLGNNDSTDPITQAATPLDEMRFDGSFSATPLVEKTNLDSGQDLDGDRRNELVDVRATGTVEGFDTLTIAAGTFRNTARIKLLVTTTIKPTAAGNSPVTVTSTIFEWRAPDVGLVQQTTVSVTDGQTESDQLVLRGFNVVGASGTASISGGSFPNRTLTAATDSSYSVGSDGTNFLVLSAAQGSASSPNRWVGQIYSPSGVGGLRFNLANYDFGLNASTVGFDGVNYLAVTNQRTTTTGARPGQSNFPLFGQRVSASGQVLDAAPGIQLAADGNLPKLAFGNGTYLMVYNKLAPSNFPSFFHDSIYGVLISPNGSVGREFLIAQGTIDINVNVAPNNPSVAFDGSNFLVAWETRDTLAVESNGIRAARVSAAGVVLDSPLLVISKAPRTQRAPSVACNGVNCLIVWTDERSGDEPFPTEVYGTLVSKEGALLSGPAETGGINISNGKNRFLSGLNVIYTGTDFAVTWNRRKDGFANERSGVFNARVSNSGVPTTGIPSTNLDVESTFVTKVGNGLLTTWYAQPTRTVESTFVYGQANR